VLIL
jgi:LSD1 subclass zinc finger protein